MRKHFGLVTELRRDDGLAMVLVMGVIVILFVLSTMLLGMTTFMISSTSRLESRVKAVHMADAGINAYLYQLRRNPLYYVTNPTLGPVELGDGRWYVTATAPTTSSPLTLRAWGAIPSTETTRRVRATVRFPTFADYTFLCNADISIGAAAVINGKIHANGSIDNDGVVQGLATAGGTVTKGVTPPAYFNGGFLANQPQIPFDTVTTDLGLMKTVAVSSGTMFPASGSKGYEVVVSGSNYTVYKVTAVAGDGTLTKAVYRASGPVPASGIVYFEGPALPASEDIWVNGNYAARITVVSEKHDIYINGNFVETTANSSFTAGIIAQQNIYVPYQYASIPQDLKIQAAMLAQTGKLGMEAYYAGVFKNTLTLDGSQSYDVQSGFVYVDSTGKQLAGFKARTYDYDQRLDNFPPPMYPTVRNGVLKVNTWVED